MNKSLNNFKPNKDNAVKILYGPGPNFESDPAYDMNDIEEFKKSVDEKAIAELRQQFKPENNSEELVYAPPSYFRNLNKKKKK